MLITVKGITVGTLDWVSMGELDLNTMGRVGDAIEVAKIIYDFGECVIFWLVQDEYYYLDTATLSQSFDVEVFEAYPFDGGFLDIAKYIEKVFKERL